MPLNHGVLMISLDFELYWGVRDSRAADEYRKNLLGVQQAVPALLALFEKEKIQATWATVGFLFLDNVKDLKAHLPKRLPDYDNKNLSPYLALDEIQKLDKSLCFAPHLINMIKNCKGQEVGTHTYSHYYCLEENQEKEDFKDDLLEAQKIATQQGLAFSSLVFPRNQWNKEYLSVLPEVGVTVYRGNEQHYLYEADSKQGKIKRAFRLLDAYLNITGHHVYDMPSASAIGLINFPASRFLRPYNSHLSMLDILRLHRIKKSMTYAAKHHKIFHLWWHPHNFGVCLQKNMIFLNKIISHYKKLEHQYGMVSENMHSLSLQENPRG